MHPVPAVVTTPAPQGLVSRVKRRLFPASTRSPSASTALIAAPRKGITFQASIAEFLLVNRLRARSRRDQASEMLERASHIVFVTCKNWFAEPSVTRSNQRTSIHETRL